MPSAFSSSEQLDERLVAKAALDAAEEQLESLCAINAGAFVSVERRGAAVRQALQDLQLSIRQANVEVETAQQSLSGDETKELQDVSERHRVRRRTLLQHSSLLELLELPQLMDACVRSNLYEQALDICGFCNTLERRHGGSTTHVVQNVVRQIRSRQFDLRRHLLNRLKSGVTMPVCLELVTALRRLNSIDLERQQDVEKLHAAMETKLQVDFLEARDAWLDDSTSDNNKHGNSEHLLDTIERYRTRCFEIATQFLAIFRANSTLSLKDASFSSSPFLLLSMWTTRRVHSFLTLLTASPIADTAALRDVWEASVFFASSMGRFGADFSALLPQILEPKCLQLVVTHWTDGVMALQETLKACANAGVASPLVSSTMDTTTASQEAVLPHVDGKTPPAPPRQLLQLPPLARFLNAYLTGLNELRRCLFANNFVQTRRALEQVLQQVKQILQAHERAVLVPGLKGDAKQLREVAATYIQVFEAVLEPYMRGALEVALGDYEAAKIILPKREQKQVQETVQEEDEEKEVEDEIDQEKEADGSNQDETKDVEAKDDPDATAEAEQRTNTCVADVEEETSYTDTQKETAVQDDHTGTEAQSSESITNAAVDEGGWNEDDFGDM